MVLTKETCENLCRAVIVKAATDYQRALCGKLTEAEVKSGVKVEECKRFFKSELFTMYSDLPGEDLMNALKREAEECGYDYAKIKKLHHPDGGDYEEDWA